MNKNLLKSRILKYKKTSVKSRTAMLLFFLIISFGCKKQNSTEQANEVLPTHSDNNNDRYQELPKTPFIELRSLEPLIGKWTITGPEVKGQTKYEWMEGGFFMLQHFDLEYKGERHKGTEYIGFDMKTKTLRSRLFEINGNNLTYTYEFKGDNLYYYFGEKGSPNFSLGVFSSNKDSIKGNWNWVEANGNPGGYSYTMTKL